MSLNLGAGDLTKATKSNYDLVVEKTSILVQFKEAAYTGEGNNNLLILKTSFSNLSFDDKIIDGIEILIGKISKKQEAKFSGIKTAAYEALIDFGEKKENFDSAPCRKGQGKQNGLSHFRASKWIGRVAKKSKPLPFPRFN